LPEPKGRTVAEIQEMFQAGLPARKFKDYIWQNDKVPVAGKASIQAQAEEEEWVDEWLYSKVISWGMIFLH
jgi:hypothetical protein